MEMFKSIGGRAAAASAALGTLVTMAFVLAGPASAEPPADPGETAINDLGAKVTLYGGAVLTLVVLSVGIFLAVKYLRKAGNKA